MARALVSLPPTRIDLAVSKTCARTASPRLERALQIVTCLADEKVVLGGTVLFWLYSWVKIGQRTKQADDLLVSATLAGALPQLLKHMANRERPDRVVPYKRGRGIPRSRHPRQSFPSGHALHLGAIAGPISRLLPKRFRLLVGRW
jgi:undecaprenyl-diphosphatase